MILRITYNTIIADIQKEFQAAFPYLKLRFLKPATRLHPSPAIKKFCDSQTRLGEAFPLLKAGQITITAQLTIEALIQLFDETFGIQVLVFRKSINLWIEITLTTSWTLEQQNNQAREISDV